METFSLNIFFAWLVRKIIIIKKNKVNKQDNLQFSLALFIARASMPNKLWGIRYESP